MIGSIEIVGIEYNRMIRNIRFKILFTCSRCKQEVEPTDFWISSNVVYAQHCGIIQRVGSVS
jgi:hypothetical protein